MDGDLPCPEFVVDERTVLQWVVYGLVEDIPFVVAAGAIGNVSVEMRAGDELHAGILRIGVVDGKPDGSGF